MDNTPRGRDACAEILWFDLLAQQALAARRIAILADRIDRPDIATHYDALYAERKALTQQFYWNEADGTFYDIRRDDPTVQVKVKTPAAYWGLLAGFCDEAQAHRMAALADDPERGFGGDIPWPRVTPDDPDFDPEGGYWRGGIWRPMVYMATCALRGSGHAEVADRLAEGVVGHMFRTWQEYEPHTIWEAYSPTRPAPSTNKSEFAGALVRPDFCRWSALGPLSLYIESVVGIQSVDALAKTVHWRIRHRSRHGIQRFRFGTITCDLVYEDGVCTVHSSEAFTLTVGVQEFAVRPGDNHFVI